ncbi:hypothetical protein RCL1_006808 [Eukaryota sp. TZLM3-RCL]
MDVCILCSSSIQTVAVFSCDHYTCSLCALRLRLLYCDHKCPYCKTEVNSLVISNTLDSYTNLMSKAICTLPSHNSITFTCQKLSKEALKKISFHCPKCPQLPPFPSSSSLSSHVSSKHSLFYCNVCMDHGFLFPSEQTLYTSSKLTDHLNGRAELSFSGHPSCSVCTSRCFDDESLFKHVVSNHLTCHLCQGSIERTGQYSEVKSISFKNSQQRLHHFRTKHYVCSVPGCLENNLSVFIDEIELAKHFQSEHGQKGVVIIDYFDTSRKVKKSQSHDVTIDDLLSRAELFSSLPQHLQAERHRQAVERVQSRLNQSEFERFLTLSAYFRDGYISADDYFQNFVELFGMTLDSEAQSIFLNLLSLLPDKLKRTELARIYSNWENQCKAFPRLKSDSVTSTTKVSGSILAQKLTKLSVGMPCSQEFPSLPTNKATSSSFAQPRIVEEPVAVSREVKRSGKKLKFKAIELK